jgi:hypothetical protein
MDNFGDIIGGIFLYSVFFTPLITIPLVWKYSKQKTIVKVLFGLFFALILSFSLYAIGFSIILRDGLGAG